MKRALTQKQLEFCRLYIETGNATEAYKRAYDTDNMKHATIARKAFELMQNGKITALIDSMQEEARQASTLTLEKHLARLNELAVKAEQNGAFGAAVNSEIARGKAAGLYTIKAEVKADVDVKTDVMTETYITRIYDTDSGRVIRDIYGSGQVVTYEPADGLKVGSLTAELHILGTSKKGGNVNVLCLPDNGRDENTNAHIAELKEKYGG